MTNKTKSLTLILSLIFSIAIMLGTSFYMSGSRKLNNIKSNCESIMRSLNQSSYEVVRSTNGKFSCQTKEAKYVIREEQLQGAIEMITLLKYEGVLK